MPVELKWTFALRFVEILEMGKYVFFFVFVPLQKSSICSGILHLLFLIIEEKV